MEIEKTMICSSSFIIESLPSSSWQNDIILKILHPGNITATTNIDKVNLLNATFASNFNYSLPRLTGDLFDTTNDVCPSEFLCTEEEV